jgi:hypothetical protein
MSIFDYGTGVSRTLQPEFHSFDTLVFQDGKPVLDSELNLLFDVISDKFQKYISNQTQSGFLNSSSFIVNSTWSNTFQMLQDFAIVNGLQVKILPSGTSNINLSTASLGSGNQRYDFIFLEVWKTMISGGATEHKPDATHIYKEGNVQNTTDTLDDDIIDPIIAAVYPETTKRVQIQYRIRIQENVAAPNAQNSNVFDAITFAQGGALLPINPFSFSNQGASTGDYGLWRAGNGDAASRLQLKSVDGYSYAIPIALVFRRSRAPFIDEDLNGQQASDVAIGGVSDRPDGLFYDSVAQQDIIDLRHKVILGQQVAYEEILKSSVKDLLTGQNNVRRPITVKYDALSDVAITGYSIVGAADKTRTVISDLQTTVVSNVIRLNTTDTDSSQDFYRASGIGNWANGNNIVVKVPAGSPTGTIILGTADSAPGTKPFVYMNDAGLSDVAGSWLNTGTATATFTLSTNISLTNQEIWITYDIQYPNNHGLTFVPDQVLNVNYVNAASFPIAQVAYSPHSGIVRAGTNLSDTSLFLSRHSKQLNYTHTGTVNSYAANYQVLTRNKQISIAPIVSSTTTVNGSTRTMFVTNTSNTTRQIQLPFATNKVWMIRGIYTASTGVTEVAAETFFGQNPSMISGQVFRHPLTGPHTPYSFAKITSVVYVPLSLDLITAGWSPVYRQSSSGDIDQFILVNSSGAIYSPLSSNVSDFQMSYSSIPTARVNAYITNSVVPTDNWITVRDDATIVDGQQLWIDMDYIAEPHDGAQVKISYSYLPYQGMVEAIELDATLKAMMGYAHSDGTANVSSNIDSKTYIRPLVSYLPTPLDVEHLIKGDSINGVANLGKFIGNDVCNTVAELLEYANVSQSVLKIDDVITARYNSGLNAVERGGNEATSLKSIMMMPLVVANHKQVAVFGIAVASTGFAMKNELVLYAWTYSNNDATNQLTSADITHIGVDFYFIKNRPLIR